MRSDSWALRSSSRARPAALLAVLLAALGLAAAALAHDYRSGELVVDHPWMPVTASGLEASVYFTVANRGETADRLLSAATPRARAVELREGSRRLEAGIEVPAGGTLALEGGPHRVVLIGPRTPLSAGQQFPLTLRFERAGELGVVIHVEPRQPPDASKKGAR